MGIELSKEESSIDKKTEANAKKTESKVEIINGTSDTNKLKEVEKLFKDWK